MTVMRCRCVASAVCVVQGSQLIILSAVTGTCKGTCRLGSAGRRALDRVGATEVAPVLKSGKRDFLSHMGSYKSRVLQL